MEANVLTLVIVFFPDFLVYGQETLTAIAPAYAANEEGADAIRPFCCRGAHNQFVYNGTNFVGAMPFGGTVTELAFRVDGPNGQPVDTVIADIAISVFTTQTNALDLYTRTGRDYLIAGADKRIVH